MHQYLLPMIRKVTLQYTPFFIVAFGIVQLIASCNHAVKDKMKTERYITYFTAWVGKDELLHFANDIYGHDKRLAEHLFE